MWYRGLHYFPSIAVLDSLQVPQGRHQYDIGSYSGSRARLLSLRNIVCLDCLGISIRLDAVVVTEIVETGIPKPKPQTLIPNNNPC